MSAQDASQKLLVVLAAEASQVIIVDRDITMTAVESKETKLVSGDGKVPWETVILPELRGKFVMVSQLHYSIEQAYGEGCISRMRVYKWLKRCAFKGLTEECVEGYQFK